MHAMNEKLERLIDIISHDWVRNTKEYKKLKSEIEADLEKAEKYRNLNKWISNTFNNLEKKE